MHGEPLAGWFVSGFQAMLALWVWGLGTLLYGMWRSVRRPESDRPRPSGPLA